MSVPQLKNSELPRLHWKEKLLENTTFSCDRSISWFLEEYDPRIHVLYFCPQLYKFDADDKLVAREGEEIGKLLAQSLEDGVLEKQPWYEPSNKLPGQPPWQLILTPLSLMDLRGIRLSNSLI